MTSIPSTLPPSSQINSVSPFRLRNRWLTQETVVWRAVLCGLGNGALLGATIAAMLAGYEQQLVPFPFSLLLFAILGFALISAGDGILTLLWKILGVVLQRFNLETAYRLLDAVPPAHLGRILAVVLFLYGRRVFPDSIFNNLSLTPSAHLIVWPMVIGGALVAVARMPGCARVTRGTLLSAAILLNAVCVGWLLYRGSDGYLAEARQTPASVIHPLDLPNPGLSGGYAVKTLTYGSGADRQRREYGVDAALTTPTVDGTPIYAGFGGLGGTIADWFWGFDYTQLPLNGRVWYPEGEGPFPLVLIVHGNHSMAHFSDPGYAYLAEHLASRGIIAVSVDQNFLNGYMLADAGGAEMPLRGWLMTG